MKKILAFALIFALVLSLGAASAFAAEISTETGTDSADVKGVYAAGATTATVYSVEVAWGAMEFTYTAAGQGAWNPATHQTGAGAAAAWTVKATDGDKITVTNHSNDSVTVGFTFAKDTTNGNNVTGSFTIGSSATAGTEFTLATAVSTEVGSAPTNFARFVPGGSIESTVTTDTKIGAITVTLS